MPPKPRAETSALAGRHLVRPSIVPVFKAAGVPRQSQNILSEPAPALMSLDVKTVILKELGLPPEPGSVYVQLSPSHPSVANKGALVFLNANVVDGGEDYASWLEGNLPSKVQIWIKSPASRTYLVECGVGRPPQPGELPSCAFRIHGPDDTVHIIKLNAWGGSVMFTLHASSNGWYLFTITGKVHGADPTTAWHFHRCEVTNL